MSTAPASLVTNQAPLSLTRTDVYDQLARRVRSEYREMPGLRLTVDQACRLWTIDTPTCSRLLQQLVAEGLVEVSERGVYSKRTTA